MAVYHKKDQDAQFRRVSVRVGVEPPYEQFHDPNVYYPDQDVVLEVLHTDGTQELYYPKEPLRIPYRIQGSSVCFPPDTPLQRLWARSANGQGPFYKVPDFLPIVEQNYHFTLTGYAYNLELVGDRYFSQVYYLEKF